MQKSVFTREYAILLELLRETRQAAGMSQVGLAKRIGETQSYVSKWERGEGRLDVIQLRRICRALGTTLPTFIEEFENRVAKKAR